MSNKVDKADAIKNHAINGRFTEIETEFGAKAALKGKEYAILKLAALKGKLDLGEDVSTQKIATDFMMFAAKSDGSQDMEQLERIFREKECRGTEECSDDLDSVATGLQQKQAGDELTQPQTGDPNFNPDSTDDHSQDGRAANFEENINTSQPTQASLPDPLPHGEGERDFGSEEPLIEAVAVKKSGFQIPVSQGVAATKRSFSASTQNSTAASESAPLKKRSFQPSTSTQKTKPMKPDKVKNKVEKSSAKDKKMIFPNAPKKPMNAYMYFVESARKDVIAEDPSLKSTEIIKELGQRWKLLEDDDKAPFEERVIAERRRYDEEMGEYHENFPDEAEEFRMSKVKGNARDKSKGSKSPHKKASSKKKSKKSTDSDEDDDDDKAKDDEEEEEKEEEDEEEEGSVDHPFDEPEEVAEKEKKILKNKGGEESEDDNFEESNLDEQTPKRPSSANRQSSVVSASHPKKRTHSSFSQPNMAVPSKRFQSSTSTSQKGRAQSQKTGPSSSQKSKSMSSHKVTPQPKVPYIDSAASAIQTAKVIASLKGIKSSDLPQSEDIKRTRIMPKEKSPFPADFTPTKGDKVTLILEPYREFVSELSVDLLSAADLELVQATCLLESITADATVMESRPIKKSLKKGDLEAGYKSAQILSVKINGELYSVLYVPFSSPLLRTEVYLLDRKTYKKSLSAKWLIPNAQVRRLFAAASGADGGGEWQEGSVVWLELERSPRSWFYAYEQLDNLCSPWDLELSQYVLPQNVCESPLPPVLAARNATAEAVLDYLKSFDFSSVFMYNLTSTDEFCEMFPQKKDRLDLHVINARCKEGRYIGSTGVGVLFDDLALMCSNGKHFNSSNVAFQPWILVDMVEKTMLHLQDHLRISTASSCSATATSSSSQCEFNSQRSSQHDEDPFEEAMDEEVEEERGTMGSALELEEV